MGDPVRPVRRFTVADLMIGVAILAPVIVFLKWWIGVPYLKSLVPMSFTMHATSIINTFIGVLLAWLGLSVLAWRARSPAPRPREWATRPGTAAAIAAVVSPIVGVLGSYEIFRRSLEVDPTGLSGQHSLYHLGSQAASAQALGVCVAAVWVLLALGGRWGRSEDWVERTGRLLGWLALLMIPADTIAAFAFPDPIVLWQQP